MPILVTADIHLTDHPRDESRWGLFQFLAEQADKYKVDIIIIAGDLTDAKDRHPARLVNDMVLGFEVLAMNGRKVFVLRGNHDYIEEQEPFFQFANSLENVKFITEPMVVGLGHKLGLGLLLPNSRTPEDAWADLELGEDYIFTHQTYQGAVAENGFSLPGGIDPAIFGDTKAKIYSGDIHVPQIVSRKPYIEYVGAPYRCRFGDSYEPRILLIQDDGTTKDLHFPTKGKHLIELKGAALKFPKIKAGDQVKVRVKLARADYPEWPAIRKRIVEHAEREEWELTGPELVASQEKAVKGKPDAQSAPASGFSPDQALAGYAERKGVSGSLKAAGEQWLKEARG